MRRRKQSQRRKGVNSNGLRRFVLREARKARKMHEQALSGELEPIEDVEAEEVEAEDYADSLEKDIDHVKALGIQEKKLRVKLRRIQETKRKIRARILKRI